MENKGFTLIEIIIAVFIIIVGVMGAFGVLQKVIVSSSVSSDKLIAAYLAQEGIEIIRNTRDSSWIDNSAWDSRVESGSSYNVDIYSTGFTDGGGTAYLKPLSTGGFYIRTLIGKFSRRITIIQSDLDGTDIYPEKMRVIVDVTWEEREKSYTTTIEEILYDYHQEIR